MELVRRVFHATREKKIFLPGPKNRCLGPARAPTLHRNGVEEGTVAASWHGYSRPIRVEVLSLSILLPVKHSWHSQRFGKQRLSTRLIHSAQMCLQPQIIKHQPITVRADTHRNVPSDHPLKGLKCSDIFYVATYLFNKNLTAVGGSARRLRSYCAKNVLFALIYRGAQYCTFHVLMHYTRCVNCSP